LPLPIPAQPETLTATTVATKATNSFFIGVPLCSRQAMHFVRRSNVGRAAHIKGSLRPDRRPSAAVPPQSRRSSKHIHQDLQSSLSRSAHHRAAFGSRSSCQICSAAFRKHPLPCNDDSSRTPFDDVSQMLPVLGREMAKNQRAFAIFNDDRLRLFRRLDLGAEASNAASASLRDKAGSVRSRGRNQQRYYPPNLMVSRRPGVKSSAHHPPDAPTVPCRAASELNHEDPL
jgi:hypothetical protein